MSGAEVMLGVVAGGAGLMSLSIQLAESSVKLMKLYHSMKGAPDTLREIASEVHIMSMSLEHLERHRQAETHGTDIMKQCIQQCRLHVSKIERVTEKLDRKMKQANLAAILYAAFRESELKGLLFDLDRARAALHLAVELYHAEEWERRWKAHQLSSTKHSDQILTLQQTLEAYQIGLQQKIDLAVQKMTDGQRCTEEDSDGSASRSKFVGKRSKARSRDTIYDGKETFRFKFRLPAWFCSTVWEIAQAHSHGGWDLCLRTWNERDENSKIFYLARTGDLDGVKTLIRRGEASLFDVCGEHNLLSVSIFSLRPSVCRWLLEHYSLTGRSITEWSEPALMRAWLWDKEFASIFLEEFDLCVSLEESNKIWALSRNMRAVQILLRKYEHRLRKMSAVERFRFGAQTFDTSDSVAVYTAKIGFGFDDPKLARLLTEDGTSALHHVAEALSHPDQSHTDEWIHAGATLISNGAYLSPLKEVPGGAVMPTTPLLQFLSASWNFLKPIEECFRGLKIWTRMLAQADVNLQEYYREETKVWWFNEMDTICKVHEEHNLVRHLLSISFQRDTWHLLVCWHNEVTIPLLHLHHFPGAFERGESVSDTICWDPSTEDSGEGHWLESERLHFPSRIFNEQVDLEASDDEDPPIYYHESLLSHTEDDNGALMRMIARSRARGGPRRRSSSQPVLTLGREIRREYCSSTHLWLPNYHFCISRSAWILSCRPHEHGEECLHLPHVFNFSMRDLRCDAVDLRRCVHVAAWSIDQDEITYDALHYNPFESICVFPLDDTEHWQKIFTHF